ncbi:peptidoglycan-binding domain-containing protein [Streptomyces sp. NPDC093224]|uniref:peptidoglycan-binding domain-containing protein n=1 Tax=Streptomyces sp. NPDC093224 TaxID=3155198 RepID=UPI0034472A39
MRNRTVPSAAVTSGAPEPEPGPAQDHLVFGKVARPDGGTPGARAQDVELFDTTLPLPRIGRTAGPYPHRDRRTRGGAGRGRKAPRPGTGAAGNRVRGDLSLPLLLSGALAAGIVLAAGLTLGTDQPSDSPTFAMPDLPPPPATVPETGPPSSPHTSPPSTATTAPTRPATTPAAPSSPRPARTATPPATQQPTPSPTRSTPPSGRPRDDVLRVGSTGSQVADLQRRLQQLHLYLGSADGNFTASVREALSRFQRSRAIPEERGVYGPLTRAVLQAETVPNSWNGREDYWRRVGQDN